MLRSAALSCEQLHAEIDHVSSDIKLLDTARVEVEAAIRSAFDLDRYRMTKGIGNTTTSGNGGGEESFARAHDEIIASKKVAVARRSFLTNLLSICKKAPGGAAQP